VPGEDALLSPEWVPYAERLRPGDVGPGDVTPKIDDDPLLVAGFEATGDEDVDQVAIWELGLGRPRVLSAEGRRPPRRALVCRCARSLARRSPPRRPPPCCDLRLLPTHGRGAAPVFGVCANEWSPSDGAVVSLDHGCGAHSEVDVDPAPPVSVGEPILDEFSVDLLTLD
jgi:hypothetical protein